MIKKINTLRFHLILIVVGVVLDQLTKLWAVARFTNESGFPNYQKVQIFGDYFRFALAYNEGAAFSSRPQDILPFLPPVVFFLLLTIVTVYMKGCAGACFSAAFLEILTSTWHNTQYSTYVIHE